jgi:tetratricopeptide (TPR) repeat protein
MVVSASRDNTVKIWSLDGRVIKTLQSNDQITDIAFSSDGKTLAASCNDNTLLLWNLDLDVLLEQGCDWVGNYTENSKDSEIRDLCDGIEFSSSTLMEQGKNLAKFGSIEKATAKFLEAQKKDSGLNFEPEIFADQIGKASKLILKGNKLARTNDVKGAIAKFENALKLDNSLNFDPIKKAQELAAGYLITEGENFAKDGNLSESLIKFRQALESNPNLKFNPEEKAQKIYIPILIDKAQQYVKDGQKEKAIEIYLEAKKNTPDRDDFNIDILYDLGLLYLDLGQPQMAKGYFIELLKNSFNLYLYGYTENARFSSIDTIFFLIGLTSELEGETKNALSWYKKVEKGEQYLKAKRSEVNILIQQGLYDDAMTICNRLIEEQPDNTDLLFVRGVLGEEMGNFDQFEKDLRRVLEINPKHVNALNSLGYALAERTARYQEAYDLLKQANELEPENPFILDSFGWVLYKMGKHSESIEYLRKAYANINVSEFPDAAAETAAHLGEVLWISGNKDEAKAVFEKALQDFPENEKVKKAVKQFLP